MDPERLGTFVEPGYYDELARLRAEAPVRRYSDHAFTIATHELVREISRQPQLFSSARGVLVNDPVRQGGDIVGSILHMDPPEHGPWRQLVSRRFTPRAVRSWEPRVRAFARDAVRNLPVGEPVDLVDILTAPYPVTVIAEILGVDDADRRNFRQWSDATIDSPDHPGERLDDLVAMSRFLRRHVGARRETPGDDVTSAVATATIDGRPIDDAAAMTYVMALLIAGNETTRHLLSGLLIELMAHPDQLAALRSDRRLIPGAVEEGLRWVTPIQAFGRTATTVTSLGGQQIDAGDYLVMLYASANRDEAAFGPTADRFDVTRPHDAGHVAFGFGEHLCMGAALARMEIAVLLEELLDADVDLHPAGEPVLTPSTLTRGWSSVPVTVARRGAGTRR